MSKVEVDKLLSQFTWGQPSQNAGRSSLPDMRIAYNPGKMIGGKKIKQRYELHINHLAASELGFPSNHDKIRCSFTHEGDLVMGVNVPNTYQAYLVRVKNKTQKNFSYILINGQLVLSIIERLNLMKTHTKVNKYGTYNFGLIYSLVQEVGETKVFNINRRPTR